MKKKRTLRTEITILTVMTSLCTLLLACVAILYVFFSFFYENTQEDIRYVLQNTSQQLQSHIQFIEDGAISIRHNVMLDDFFNNAGYDENVAKEQLSYCMKLSSDRNTINRQLPFVVSVYLFNNQDEYVYERYYASTVDFQELEVERYSELHRKFKKQEFQYKTYTDAENISLCFRIYDDQMQEQGICIAEINGEAIEMVLGEMASYKNGVWIIMDNRGEILSSHGKEDNIKKLWTIGSTWQGKKKIDSYNMLGYVNPCSFGIYSIVSVGQENIFALLEPTVLIFGVGFILVLVLTVFVAFSTSYRFTKPMSGLSESIKAFGDQNFDVRMGDSSIQEFHDIGVVFNEMADHIKYLITQVYEKEILAARLQVKYLQAQINPHFQFNVLAMLGLKAKIAGNEELYEGLQAFSGLVQGKIFREGEIMIRVSEELEIVQFYLYLQHSRFQEKISYEIKLAEEEISQDLIPKLLIEPLVENAVSHGLEPKSDKGRVQVSLWECEERDGRMLHICVEDDGVGFDPENLDMEEAEDGAGQIPDKDMGEEKAREKVIRKLHTHMGLANTRSLLEILYGNCFRMEIQGKKGKGTRIEIVLPVQRGEKNVESNGGG